MVIHFRGVLVAALLAPALIAGPAVAEQIDVPGHYPTIQEAIDAAASGDEIVVADGTWTGPGNRDLDFGGRLITVRSANGFESCIIDCEESARAFYFHNGETAQARVVGFAIINGYTNGRGGAILCESAGPTIRACDFRDNTADSAGPATGNGGAIFCSASDAVIVECRFTGNRAIANDDDQMAGLGGAILFIDGSSGTVTDCDFAGNAAIGPGIFGNGIGGAIFVAESNSLEGPPVAASSAMITDSTFTGNSAAIAGGAVWVQGIVGGGAPPASSVEATDCTFTENSAQSGGAMAAFLLADSTISDCDFEGNWTIETESPVQQGIGGGAIGTVLFSTTAITDSTFVGNHSTSGLGGAVSSSFGNDTTISDSVFRENAAGQSGGALANHALVVIDGTASVMTVHDCSFEANSAALLGGAIFNTEGSSLSIDDSTFEENSVSGTGPGVARGGAIACREMAALLVADSTFSNNTASGAEGLPNGVSGGGGALDIGGATATLSDCSFHANRAIALPSGPPPDPPPANYPVTGYGGAALLSGDSIVTFTDCSFIANEAVGDTEFIFDTGIGGALFVIGNDPVFEDCVFEENAAYLAGGAAYMQEAAAQLHDCSFEHNVAQSGGALALFLFGSPTIDDCSFVGNRAVPETLLQPEIGGGAIGAVLFSRPTVTDSVFAGNTSTGVAGAVSSLASSHSTYVNCDFRGNEAETNGGAVTTDLVVPYIPGLDQPGRTMMINCLLACNTAGARGGGAANGHGSETSMINCSLGHNVAFAEGGGVASYGVSVNDPPVPSRARLVNSIAWDNEAADGEQIADLDGADATAVSYSIVEGGWPGVGNLDMDPDWEDAGDDDCEDDSDYGLSDESPAIDAGANNAVPMDVLDLDDDGDRIERVPLDLDQAFRFADDPETDDAGCGLPVVVDMGAYEYQGDPVHPVLFGDIDGDGAVGMSDLMAVLSAWGECDDCCLADIDFNGEVNFTDLLNVLANWS